MAPKSSPKKITLIQKLICSYAAIFFFALIGLVISYTGLYSLNKIVKDIATNDFVLINSANKLRESLLAQQSYAAKYAILKSPEFKDLFANREAEFLEILQKMQNIIRNRTLEDIALSYRNFNEISQRLFGGMPDDPSILKPAAEKVTAAIEKNLAERHTILDKKLEASEQQERSTIRWILLLSLVGFALALGVAALLIYNITSAVSKLKKATHRIAEGDFDFDPNIPKGDEVGDFAEDFTRMARRLKELEQMSLDASPLTRLPGNIAIEQVLERKLAEGKPFAVCYADLDNFKAYNDRYGYIKGSDLIRKTGEIIYEAVNACDGHNAFVGHIGGDDFVMVVMPEKAAEICAAVIDEFDRMIPGFYTPEDVAKGETKGIDRYGVSRTFPLMTISIAIVICQKGTFDSAVSVARAAAEMKDQLKGKAGSIYAINRRTQPR